MMGNNNGEPGLLDELLAMSFGALAAAMTATYYMTVTDTEHIYERDFVLAYRDGERVVGEVVSVHQETNTLAVRLFENGERSNEILTTPAELVDLHPSGRPLDDDTFDPLEGYKLDRDSLDTDDNEDD